MPRRKYDPAQLAIARDCSAKVAAAVRLIGPMDGDPANDRVMRALAAIVADAEFPELVLDVAGGDPTVGARRLVTLARLAAARSTYADAEQRP